MHPIPLPAKADPGTALEEMKTFVKNHVEDFVNPSPPKRRESEGGTQFR